MDFTQSLTVNAGDSGLEDITPPFVPDFQSMAISSISPALGAGENIFTEKEGSATCRVRWVVTQTHTCVFGVNNANNDGNFVTAPTQAPAGTVTPEIQTEDG